MSKTLAAEAFVRASLAFVFVGLLAAILVWGFMRSDDSRKAWSQTKEFLDLILPAVTALLGSAVGFYFGTRKSA